jgi:hypothetical protein
MMLEEEPVSNMPCFYLLRNKTMDKVQEAETYCNTPSSRTLEKIMMNLL